MKVFVLLAFIPSLIVADILCPNSKTTCPEDKQCCEVDGRITCCDLDDDGAPASRVKVYPGDDLKRSSVFEKTMSPGNESMSPALQYCDFTVCSGTCCGSGCCPYTIASCCAGNRCCPSLNTCCNDGCCGALQKCCGNGCCDYSATCCESWCCKKGYRCGSRYMSCRSKGFTISPEVVTLLIMVGSVFISRRL